MIIITTYYIDLVAHTHVRTHSLTHLLPFSRSHAADGDRLTLSLCVC